MATMASFSALLSVLFLVAGAQSAAVPSPVPMLSSAAAQGAGMASSAAAKGAGMAGSAAGLGAGMASSAAAKGAGMASSAAGLGAGMASSAAGLGAAATANSGRIFKEMRTFNENFQNTMGKAMNGGASVLNNLLKVDADALKQAGELMTSIAHLTGATTEQMMNLVRDIMAGGPRVSAQYIQRALEFIAKNKEGLGTKIVSTTSSFTDGMRQKSNVGIDMLENMNNFLGSGTKFTSALNNPSLAASGAVSVPVV